MKPLKNTKITQRERFKMSMMGTESFPPCGDMPWLMSKLKDAGFKVNGSILDVGCGQGRFSRYVAQLTGVKEILGIDVSQECVDLATDRSPGHTLAALSFKQAEILKYIRAKKKKYDIISAFNIFEYMDEPKALLNLLKDRLKKNGYLIGSVWSGGVLPDSGHNFDDAKTFGKKFPELKLVEMLKPDMKCLVFIYQNKK